MPHRVNPTPHHRPPWQLGWPPKLPVRVADQGTSPIPVEGPSVRQRMRDERLRSRQPVEEERDRTPLRPSVPELQPEQQRAAYLRGRYV